MARIVIWGATEERYEVYVMEDGETIEEYSSGNSALDSQGYVPLDSPYALSVKRMREYAEDTAKDMAEEYGAEYAGEDPDTTDGIREMYRTL